MPDTGMTSPARPRTFGSRLKIGLAFSFLAALLFMAVGGLSGLHARRQLEKNTGEALAQMASNVALSLDMGLFERHREISNLAAMENLLKQPIDAPAWTDLVERLRATLPHYSWIGVADAKGTVIAATQQLLMGRDVSKRPWFINGMGSSYAGDIHEALLLSKFLPAAANGEPLRFLDFSAPLVRDGRTLGVVGSHLNWAWAQERSQKALGPIDGHRQVEVAILDPQGRELLRPPRAASAFKLSSDQVQRVLASRYGVATWEDGQRYLTAAVRSTGYQSYPGLGWTIVVRQPLSTAMAAAYDLQRWIWGLGIIGAILFGVVGWALAGRLTKPLRAVATQAADVAERMHLALDGGESKDEVGQLAASLGSLVAQVQARDRELRSLNEGLEIRVAERTESLRQANADMEAFSRSISHDLKAPLGSMGLMMRTLLSTRGERFERHDQSILGALADECDRLHILVDEMMALAQVEHRPLSFSKVGMGGLVEAVVASLRTSASMGQGGSPNTEVLVSPLPEIEGDPVLLRQVWQNLLSNAFKFTAKAAAPRIEVGCREDGEDWVFWVKDNGAGFDPAQANLLFGVYQRLHDAKDYPGTGVGLTIVKRVVHRHGGKIWCEARLGQGAQFFFSLPQSHQGAPAEQADLAVNAALT